MHTRDTFPDQPWNSWLSPVHHLGAQQSCARIKIFHKTGETAKEEETACKAVILSLVRADYFKIQDFLLLELSHFPGTRS